MCDETSTTIYLNLFNNNVNPVSSLPVLASINKQFSNIVDDLSEYNMYLNAVTITSSELAFRNTLKDINWNQANFATNKTNLSISFYDPTGYNFNLAGNTNLLVTGIDENGNTNTFRGVAVFLQYVSENADPTMYPNPNVNGAGANSAGYSSAYFNVHSIQQMLDMINSATISGLSYYTPVIADKTCYFYYQSSTGLYVLQMSDDLKSSNINIYCNAFLERLMLDGFRWQYIKDTNITTEVPYRGMDNMLIKNNVIINKNTTSNIWTYNADSSKIQNLLDIHSLVVTCDGSMNVARKQVFEIANTSNYTAVPVQMGIVKMLDFVFDSSSASINNSTIQFESTVLDRPINFDNASSLSIIQFNFMIQKVDGSFFQLNIAAGGYLAIRVALKRRTRRI